jgi:hypothetical protein
MSSNRSLAGAAAEFRCPVCRARQELSETCRRCQADLTLAVKIRQRLWYLQALPPSPGVQAEIAAICPSESSGGPQG